MSMRSSPLSSGPPSQSGPDDVKRANAREHSSYLTQMRRNDAAQREKYESQMRSEGIDPATGLPTSSPHRQPIALTGVDRAARGVLSSATGGTVAGTALGGFVYFLGLAWLRGGSAGAKNWLKAKFANITPGSTSSLPIGKATTTNSTTSAPGATSAGTKKTGAIA